MNRRLAIALTVVVLLALGVAGYLVLRPDSSPSISDALDAVPIGGSSGPDPEEAAVAEARDFLQSYLAPDGRVIRHDQGSDTVSEGQAYAMLLAVAAGDRASFESAWGWAQTNLQRPDGLLSWLWSDGEVADVQPATDGDLDVARALVLAAERFEVPAWREEAVRISEAILERETVAGRGGRLLIAGPWATDPPYVVNPSYFSPHTYAALGNLSGDARWEEVSDVSEYVLDELRARDPGLPSDWARVRSDGTVVAAGPPGSTERPLYGWDAVRVPIRMSEDCGDYGRGYAASLWRFFDDRRENLAAVYSLDGEPQVDYQSPIGLVAAAAAAHSAGDEGESEDLLAEAGRLEDDHPTYYSAAWVALGRVMLTTDLLDSC